MQPESEAFLELGWEVDFDETVAESDPYEDVALTDPYMPGCLILGGERGSAVAAQRQALAHRYVKVIRF